METLSHRAAGQERERHPLPARPPRVAVTVLVPLPAALASSPSFLPVGTLLSLPCPLRFPMASPRSSLQVPPTQPFCYSPCSSRGTLPTPGVGHPLGSCPGGSSVALGGLSVEEGGPRGGWSQILEGAELLDLKTEGGAKNPIVSVAFTRRTSHGNGCCPRG